jgi:glutamate N-acetyltransferase/amino-acid N-acetyltransferase
VKNQAQVIQDGSITSPAGFKACGIRAGIKPNRPDMALIYSSRPAAIAGVFTSNRVKAAPVRLDQAHLAGGMGQAIIINSGNANACTGKQGEQDAWDMATMTAELLGIPVNTVFVCSTGTIGRRMPMDLIKAGIRQTPGKLTNDGGTDAADAIMTTDTRRKQTALRLEIDGHTITIGGMAKGSGMICPNMATMLAFITTDAAVEQSALQTLLRNVVNRTFNRITVDGDQSTNDTVLCLANGAAGNQPLRPGHPHWLRFRRALESVALQLALMIVRDGEGATKMVTVRVSGAPSRRAADRIARAIAHSLLVKTSWFGADPNWGRVICAVGYSGAPIRPELIDILYDGQCAVRAGQSAGMPEKALHAIIAKPEFTLEVDLHQGRSSAVIYTCDCSDQYVAINAAYMT